MSASRDVTEVEAEKRRLLVEGLPDPAYTHLARGVRDMRHFSVFKRGRFPDAQC